MAGSKSAGGLIGKAHAVERQKHWERIGMMLTCDKCGGNGASRKVVTVTDTVGHRNYHQAHDLCRACWRPFWECLWSREGGEGNDARTKDATRECDTAKTDKD